MEQKISCLKGYIEKIEPSSLSIPRVQYIIQGPHDGCHQLPAIPNPDISHTSDVGQTGTWVASGRKIREQGDESRIGYFSHSDSELTRLSAFELPETKPLCGTTTSIGTGVGRSEGHGWKANHGG